MYRFLATALALSCLLSAPALAGDPAAGKSKSASCAGCHGLAGISANPLWPHLAGQNEAYLVKQMNDFKAGTRSDPIMTALMAPLTEEDVADIAAYYASLECK